MHFILWNFFILEVSFNTLCIPRYLYMLASGDNTVTYNLCAIQFFFLIILGVTVFFLLMAMFYAHYVAICKPLHYTTIMNNMVCNKSLIVCYMIALIIIIPFGMGFELEFCDSNVTLTVMLLPS